MQEEIIANIFVLIPTHGRHHEEIGSDAEMANAVKASLGSSLDFPFRVAWCGNAASAFGHGNCALSDVKSD